LVKALGDRLAEAFAEYLHEKVRKEIWGYASEENLSNQDLIAENYKGIRPAPGYPACPDHLEKATLWHLLDVENVIGVKLTESPLTPKGGINGGQLAEKKVATCVYHFWFFWVYISDCRLVWSTSS